MMIAGDVGATSLWGDFLQTYSMVGIIDSAMLSAPWDSRI